MELREWLFRKRMKVTALAKELGVSRGHLNQIVNQKRSPSPQLSKKIEEFTEGEVTKEEMLFPEDFQ